MCYSLYHDQKCLTQLQISVITGSLKNCCTVDSLMGCFSINNCLYPWHTQKNKDFHLGLSVLKKKATKYIMLMLIIKTKKLRVRKKKNIGLEYG